MPTDPTDLDVLQAGDGAVAVTVDLAAGARLASLVVGGHELLVGADDGLPGPTGWGCFPMVPWAGRIREGRFPVGSGGNRHDVRLPTNLAPHAIHGTTFDRPWTRTGPGRASCDLGPTWPWPGRVDQTVALTERSLTLTLEVTAGAPSSAGAPVDASEQRAMPVSLGWHPWFRRSVGGVDVRLDLPAEAMWRRDAAGIPDGELVPPPPGPWDDCFTALIGPVQLDWPGVLTLWVESDCEHVVVYDEQPHAVCVEPQTAPPDAHNSGEDLVWLAPGDSLLATCSWTWRLAGSDPSPLA